MSAVRRAIITLVLVCSLVACGGGESKGTAVGKQACAQARKWEDAQDYINKRNESLEPNDRLAAWNAAEKNCADLKAKFDQELDQKYQNPQSDAQNYFRENFSSLTDWYKHITSIVVSGDTLTVNTDLSGSETDSEGNPMAADICQAAAGYVNQNGSTLTERQVALADGSNPC